MQNPLKQGMSARMEGWEEQQQKEPFYRGRAVVYFIFADCGSGERGDGGGKMKGPAGGKEGK